MQWKCSCFLGDWQILKMAYRTVRLAGQNDLQKFSSFANTVLRVLDLHVEKNLCTLQFLNVYNFFKSHYFTINVLKCKTRGPGATSLTWVILATYQITLPVNFFLKSFHVNMTYSGSVILKKILKWTHPIFVIISPLKRTWPFIWTI
jgi:hypothetical protein